MSHLGKYSKSTDLADTTFVSKHFMDTLVNVKESFVNMQFSLSALEFSPVFRDKTATNSLWSAIDLAPELEALGYMRFWIAEHHSPRVAHSSPQIFAAIIAGVTQRMRVGVAGVLLNCHSPLRIAKDFSLLNTIYPDRIDLGIARGGVDDLQRRLLGGGEHSKDHFAPRVEELLEYFSEGNALMSPYNVWPPPVWLLGSGTTSAKIASKTGSNFCFAAFLSRPDVSIVEILHDYKLKFKSTVRCKEAKCCIAVAGICAPTVKQAEEMYMAESPVRVLQAIIGSPAEWKRSLETLNAATGVTDFVVLDLCRSSEARLASFRLLAETFLKH